VPTIRYALQDGTAVTGTTTIISEFKNPGPLLNWTYKIGFESGKNQQLQDLNMEHGPIQHWTDLRDTAGDQGTLIHDYAEKHILGEIYEMPSDEIVLAAHLKFKEWWSQQDYKVEWTEKNMVSEKLKYGGCPDVLAIQESDHFAKVLIDFKTGKAIYPETILQMGAYDNLIHETQGFHCDKAIIVRIPKDNRKIETKIFSSSQLKLGFKQFDLLRKAHINNFKLKKIFEKRKRKK
tara:strand:+ start:55 stop:759 length:705 start_codon:yes stop_codon:yes gene_type:complete